jgi:hypothetical protein
VAVKVLALASGVTGLADHRMLEGNFAASNGTTVVRSGLFPGSSPATLSTVSAMVARVNSFRAVIANGVSSTLGPYLFVSDTTTDITFAAGEASVARVDRIIARVYDNVNDGSGSTQATVEYLKGQSSGSASSLPTNSLLLWEMTVPAGASSGTGGINFSNAVDKRVWTTAAGGIIPIANATDMAAMTAYEGMVIYRTDLDILYIHDGTNFKGRGVASVASSSNLSSITNPYDGQLATTRDTDAIYLYNGTSWVSPKNHFKPVGRIHQATAQSSLADNAIFAVTFDASDIDTHSFHSNSTNNSRVTPNVAGYYKFNGVICFSAQSDYVALDAFFRLNGSNNIQGATRITPSTTATTVAIPVSTIQNMNGSTDYIELVGRPDRSGNSTSGTAVSAFLGSTLEWEYLGPTSY